MPTAFSPPVGARLPSNEQFFDTLYGSVRQDLVELGRQYSWQRPLRCPRCAGVRVSGHGSVTAYFDEAGSQGVYLKRYRCRECRVVIRLRPSGYWKRIQASVAKFATVCSIGSAKGAGRQRATPHASVIGYEL